MKIHAVPVNIVNWVLFVAGLVNVIAGTAYICFANTANAGAALAAGLVLLLAATIERFEFLKGWGMEAKTRDVVARAEHAVSELQLLAVQVAELSLSVVTRQGRLGGYSDDEQEALRASVVKVLGKLGLPEGSIQSVLREWHRATEFDYSYYILGGETVPAEAPPEALAEWKAMRKGAFANVPSPDALRAFLSKHSYLTVDIEERLKDYEHYRVNRIHRRPEVWGARTNWGRLKRPSPGS